MPPTVSRSDPCPARSSSPPTPTPHQSSSPPTDCCATTPGPDELLTAADPTVAAEAARQSVAAAIVEADDVEALLVATRTITLDMIEGRARVDARPVASPQRSLRRGGSLRTPLVISVVAAVSESLALGHWALSDGSDVAVPHQSRWPPRTR